MRYGFLLFALLVPPLAAAQGTGTLAGRVIDSTGEGLPGANVLLDGTALGTATDVDGHYRIIGVPVGTYSMTASYVGYEAITEREVAVESGYTRTVDFDMGTPTTPFDGLVIGCYYEFGPPLISNDPYAVRVLSGDAIARLPMGR